MNTPNNKRRRESQRRMERTFVQLLQERELDAITVTDICKGAGVNRTTFYANYTDIYALAEAIGYNLLQEVMDIYRDEQTRRFDTGFLALFRHIKENQLFYKTYFKLELNIDPLLVGFDVSSAEAYRRSRYLDYHTAFFKSGLNAIIKMWLDGGCRETPEEITQILKTEYDPKGVFFPAVEMPEP